MINKAVFTHWSDTVYLNRYCGFNSKKDFFYSFGLALFCARSFFSKVILYTDKNGLRDIEPFHQLIDEVHTDIEVLNTHNAPRSLWAYPKIITYSLQEDPFLHVDNDVFLWEKPKIEFLEQELVCQSIEYKMQMYNFCFKRILNSPLRPSIFKNLFLFKKLCYLFKRKKNHQNPILTPNFGVFGGNDVTFIQKYAKNVLDILSIKKNKEYLNKHDLGDSFNAIFEQWIFSQMAFNENKKITPLLKPPPGYIVCNEIDPKNAKCIYNAPDQVKYTHLVAGSKRDPSISIKVENKVKSFFPQKIINMIDNKI